MFKWLFPDRNNADNSTDASKITAVSTSSAKSSAAKLGAAKSAAAASSANLAAEKAKAQKSPQPQGVAAPAAAPAVVYPAGSYEAVMGAGRADERAKALGDWLASSPDHAALKRMAGALQTKDRSAAKRVKDLLLQADAIARRSARVQELLAQADALAVKAELHAQDLVAFDAALVALQHTSDTSSVSDLEPHLALRARIALRLQAQAELQAQLRAWHARSDAHCAALQLTFDGEFASAKLAWEQLRLVSGTLASDAQELQTHAEWQALTPKLHAGLRARCSETVAAWERFERELALAIAAFDDVDAPLPMCSTWAAELQGLRDATDAHSMAAREARKAKAREAKTATREQRQADIEQAVVGLEAALKDGHSAEAVKLADNLRVPLSRGEVPEGLQTRMHAAMADVQELQGWLRWRNDELRDELCKKAELLLQAPLAPRAQGDAVRTLRERWKQLDRGGAQHAANVGVGPLWQRFNAACETAYAPVAVFLDAERAKFDAIEAERRILMAQLQAWTLANAPGETSAEPNGEPIGDVDWRQYGRALDVWVARWRDGGHLPESRFNAVQADWRAQFDLALAPLKAAGEHSRAQREAYIAQASRITASNAASVVDALRELQNQWQAEAQRVPLPRGQEQALWAQFRAPVDAWHLARKAVYDARAEEQRVADGQLAERTSALQAATQAGDAAAITQALAELATLEASARKPAFEPRSHGGMAGSGRASGRDERSAAPSARHSRESQGRNEGRNEGREGRDGRDGRSSSAAKRSASPAEQQARRAAQDAQGKLDALARAAREDGLAALITAWQQRSAEGDARQACKTALGAAAKKHADDWLHALAEPPVADHAKANSALIRLEIAAERDSPAVAAAERRAIQLATLAGRNHAELKAKWPADVAQVLAAAHEEQAASRLRAVLAALL